MAVSVRAIVVDAWSPVLAAARGRVGNMRPAHKQAGEVALNMTRANFQDNGGPNRWPDLSEATLLQRARGVSGKGKVYQAKIKGLRTRRFTKRSFNIIENAKALIWTGRLLRSLEAIATADYAEVGSNLVYASRQFFGSKEPTRWGKGAMVSTPARNPFGLRPAFVREIASIYERFIADPFRRAA